MDARLHYFGVALFLATASLLFAPVTAEAQRRGWGSRGGGVRVEVGVGSRGYYDRGFYGRGYYGSGYYGPSYYGGRGSYYYPRYYSSWVPDYSYRNYYQPYSMVETEYSNVPPVQEANTAQVIVHVPAADAEVWFSGTQTAQSGLERSFVTPPLNFDSSYSYEIRARWRASNGQTIDHTRTVRFQAGQTVHVDFRSAS